MLSPSRVAPLPTLAVATMLGLGVIAGCSADAEGPEPSATASETSTPPAREPASNPSATPSPSPSDAPPTEDPANPDPLPTVTEPGTRVQFGETITAREAVGVLSEDEGWSVLRYAVTGIEPGDDSLIDTLDNADEYAGGSVFYVRGTVEVVALFGAGIDGIVGGAITGVQDDGLAAAGVFGIGASPETCQGSFVIFPASVGASEETCAVAIAKPGTEIVAAAYYADAAISSDGPSDDPYFADPVVWLP